MQQDDPKNLLYRLIAEHYVALLAFFGRRIRNRGDAADLAQEVYVRVLRASQTENIRDPQAYLFAVAGNLLREQALLDRRRAASVDIQDAAAAEQLQEIPDFASRVDHRARIQRLRVVLEQLPVKCRAVVMLQYRHDLSHLEIAERLGISTHMVKKYLAQALAHCRRRMQRLA